MVIICLKATGTAEERKELQRSELPSLAIFTLGHANSQHWERLSSMKSLEEDHGGNREAKKHLAGAQEASSVHLAFSSVHVPNAGVLHRKGGLQPKQKLMKSRAETSHDILEPTREQCLQNILDYQLKTWRARQKRYKLASVQHSAGLEDD